MINRKKIKENIIFIKKSNGVMKKNCDPDVI